MFFYVDLFLNNDFLVFFFKSYVGLNCEEIKGYFKSVGYEFGMKIKFEYFQNIWNVVFIDGDWWLVQCNWGVRQVLNFFYKWIMGFMFKIK